MNLTQVPVDEAGNWLGYPDWNNLWAPAIQFQATMGIDGMYSGRSAKGLILVNVDDGRKYQMFIGDFVKLLPKLTIINAVFSPMLWEPCKRGQNYAVRPVL